jgi:esterase FrsA
VAYEFAVDAEALFAERYPQFVNLGLVPEDLNRVRATITTMWADRPGGWTFEFTALARGYAERGEHHLAALAYGAARFPVLTNQVRREALRRQVEEYQKAAPTFGVRFDRRILALPYQGATTRVPVHLLSAVKDHRRTPVLLFSGGLDTWKMDLHPLAVAFARGAGVTVLAFDHPGTGETEAPLDGSADVVIHGLIDQARRIGNGMVGHFGFSFGGNFSAATGLSGAVDAAICLGGPVRASFEPANLRRLRYSMAGIAGNAYGFTAPPSEARMLAASVPFDRDALLGQDRNAPMLVVNGADDVHVPRADTLVFRGRRHTETRVVPGTGHGAASKLPEVIPIMIDWLRASLAG